MKIWDGKTKYTYAQLKLDGFSCRITPINATKKSGVSILDKVECLPSVQNAMRCSRELSADVLGELIYPGGTSEDVQRFLAESPEKLVFVGYALDGPGVDPRLELGPLGRLLGSYGIQSPAFIHLYPDDPMPSMADAEGMSKGAEGWVFKNANLMGWRKLKSEFTIDVIIKGYIQGKGQHSDKVGSIICEMHNGPEVCCVGGMNKPERLEITRNKANLIGQVIEVAYTRVGNQGRLKHPRFIRHRTDVLNCQCTLDQDVKLAAVWEAKNERDKDN